MTTKKSPSAIKKYANRRLYHTGTSTYVTLDDLAARPDFKLDITTTRGLGRELFAQLRSQALPADQGGGLFCLI
jgi:hypothetical protein